MSRPSTLLLALSALTIGLSGCGGTKNDFSVLPKSFTIQSASPKDADAVVVTGIARDGRLMGTYKKKTVTTTFGWIPDGQVNDIELPKECKEANGINELGGVSCADRKAKPQKMFQWQSGGVDSINVPTGAVLDSFGAITYNSFFLVNLHIGTGKSQGFQLKLDEAPKAITTPGGSVVGSSLSGNIAGVDAVGSEFHAIAVIDKKKIDLGLMGGNWTRATSVNDDGVVVGDQYDKGGASQAFKWKKGVFTALPNPAGATKSFALDVNDGGVISGYAQIAGENQACVWYPGHAPVLLKDMTPLPAGVRLEKADVLTPLGIVVCEGSRTTKGVTKAELFGLYPEFP